MRLETHGGYYKPPPFISIICAMKQTVDSSGLLDLCELHAHRLEQTLFRTCSSCSLDHMCCSTNKQRYSWGILQVIWGFSFLLYRVADQLRPKHQETRTSGESDMLDACRGKDSPHRGEASTDTHFRISIHTRTLEFVYRYALQN